jgi:hypothetical protein
VLVFLSGHARLAGAMNGLGTGMSVVHARCTDTTTGQSVDFTPDTNERSWDCVGAGLLVAADDAVSMLAVGVAD